MIILRLLQLSDVPSITSINNQSLTETWSEAMFLSELYDKNKVYVVAEIDNNIVGFGGFSIVIDEAEIMNIAVVSEYRGQGIGKAIVKELIRYAYLNKLSKMSLDVRETNTMAIKLYQNIGFVYVGTRPNYYQNGVGAMIFNYELK